MFDLNNDVIYSDWLKPQDGYELAFGVCCTYSLDLEAVLGTMLVLGSDSIFEKNINENPAGLLKGIQIISSKLAFFCSDCAIKNTNFRFRKLIDILDNAIFEVKPESGGIFHPKLWFLHYTPRKKSEDPKDYVRLLILTKNLTFDQSLDFGISLEADVEGSKGLPNNQPLIEMLEYLENNSHLGSRQDKFNKLQEAFEKAGEFEYGDKFEYEVPNGKRNRQCSFSECEFIPVGIGYNKQNEKLNFLLESPEKDWFICISPFLTDDIVGKMTAKVTSGEEGKKSAILTRRDALSPRIFDIAKNCFCVKTGYRNFICNEDDNNGSSDADDNQREKNGYSLQGDIHAKMYFVSAGSDVYFYAGSANATYNSFNRNVEFLVRLKYDDNNPPGYENLLYMLNLLDDENNISPFERIKKEDLSENDNQKEEENYKAFQEFRDHIDNIKARVEAASENEYRVSFEDIDTYFNGIGITIALNGTPSKSVLLQPGACIDGVKLTELSDLYIIKIPEGNSLNLPQKTFVKKIPTDGIPQNRDSEIVSSFMKSNVTNFDELSVFLNGFLDRQPSVPSKSSQAAQRSAKKKSKGLQSELFNGYYEELLHLAFEKPEHVKALSKSLKNFSLEEPEAAELVEMIKTFCSAVDESPQRPQNPKEQ